MTLTSTATHNEPIAERSAIHDGHPAIWRLLIALPPVIGSVTLLVLVLGWMGTWEGIALVTWLACTALIVTRVGERAAVTVALGFRRPSPAQTELLASAWSAALYRAELPYCEVDLYVHRSLEPNAFAAGTRSVAVTRGLLQLFAARRLTEDHIRALLVHELGHHAAGTTRGGLPAAWLALPWRLATRLVFAGTSMAARRTQGSRSFLVVVVAGVGVAIVQAVQQRNWTVLFVLGALSLCALLCPIADAAMARRGEYEADRFADALGYGTQLSSALKILDGEGGRQVSLIARTRHRHPSTGSRIRALEVDRERA